MPCAIITGTAGQDGSYLAEFLLRKGYHVFGMIRRNSSIVLDRLKEARKHPNMRLIYGDVTDIASIYRVFQEAMSSPHYEEGPLEVYNLAAQSHVWVSFETPIYTCQADAMGVVNVLEAILALNLQKKVRLYQASTSELYGSTPPPQNENTPFHPRSPYAAAKLYAYWMVRNYRDGYGLYAVNGILFNHESERRGENFVSRKITRAVAKYFHGQPEVLKLGNMNALRDWGHAEDYVEAMWMMLQKDTPSDLVIATGVSHTVKEFVEEAFKVIGVNIRWDGVEGWNASTGELLVTVDPQFYRKTEVDALCGDASQAHQLLGWSPKTNFNDLVKRMVMSDISSHHPNA